mgnify:CR=1
MGCLPANTLPEIVIIQILPAVCQPFSEYPDLRYSHQEAIFTRPTLIGKNQILYCQNPYSCLTFIPDIVDWLIS